ncbi:hypothetical protein ACSMXN_19860 [Jatrophihabitans sp. DSM 45814]
MNAQRRARYLRGLIAVTGLAVAAGLTVTTALVLSSNPATATTSRHKASSAASGHNHSDKKPGDHSGAQLAASAKPKSSHRRAESKPSQVKGHPKAPAISQPPKDAHTGTRAPGPIKSVTPKPTEMSTSVPPGPEDSGDKAVKPGLKAHHSHLPGAPGRPCEVTATVLKATAGAANSAAQLGWPAAVRNITRVLASADGSLSHLPACWPLSSSNGSGSNGSGSNGSGALGQAVTGHLQGRGGLQPTGVPSDTPSTAGSKPGSKPTVKPTPKPTVKPTASPKPTSSKTPAASVGAVAGAAGSGGGNGGGSGNSDVGSAASNGGGSATTTGPTKAATPKPKHAAAPPKAPIRIAEGAVTPLRIGLVSAATWGLTGWLIAALVLGVGATLVVTGTNRRNRRS